MLIGPESARSVSFPFQQFRYELLALDLGNYAVVAVCGAPRQLVKVFARCRGKGERAFGRACLWLVCGWLEASQLRGFLVKGIPD